MRHRTLTCLMAGVLLCFTAVTQAAFRQVLNDDFNADHTYYDGVTVNTVGTQWDGISGEQFLERMDANFNNHSVLTMKLKDTGDPTSIGDSDYRFPLLFKNVSGDFVAEMKIKNPIPDDYIIYLLGCIDPATSNDYMAGAFPVAGPAGWGFYDYDASHTAGARVLDNGIGPYVDNNLCYRVARSGNTFTTYSRLDESQPWTEINTYTHPETLPATLSVGMLVAEHVLHGFEYEFEYFTIFQDTGSGLWEERFDYPDGWSDQVTGGRWQVWLGPDNSDPALITNDMAYGSSGKQLRLTQGDVALLPSPAGWQEVTAFTDGDLFESSDVGTIGFSFGTPGSTNQEYYLWFAGGDPTVTNMAYTSSGLGAFMINWIRTNSTMTSLHVWNDFGIFEIALGIPTMPTEPFWHDVRAVMFKDDSLEGITGGWASIFLDGDYMGDVPFPLQNVDNVLTGIVNCMDFYAANSLPTGPKDRCLVDNIFIEDTEGYTRFVSPDGDDMNDGLSPVTPWQTIAHALWQLPSGMEFVPSTVNVGPGTYVNEHTMAATNGWQYGLYCRAAASDRPNIYCIDVIGAGANNTIIHQDFSGIDGIGGLDTTMGFYDRGLKDWHIEGFTIQMTTNLPEDVWGWYYGCIFMLGAHGSSISDCITDLPFNWAKGKCGININTSSDILIENCLFMGGGVGFGCNNAGQSGMVIQNCTSVGQRQGTAEGNSGIGFAYNGYSGTVTRCIVADADKGALLAGSGDVMHSVENAFYMVGDGGTTMYYAGTIIPSNDILQEIVFDNVGDLPYCAGLDGFIGWKGGGTVYVSPNPTGPMTMGTTPGTAFAMNWLPQVCIQCPRGVPGDNNLVQFLSGVFTNPASEATVANMRFWTPNCDVLGMGPENTILRYVDGLGINVTDIRNIRWYNTESTLGGFKMDGDLIGTGWWYPLIYLYDCYNGFVENIWIEFPTNILDRTAISPTWVQLTQNMTVRNVLVDGGGIGIKDFNNLTMHKLKVENCTLVNQRGSNTDRGFGLVFEGNSGDMVSKCVIQNADNYAVSLWTPAVGTSVIYLADSVWNNCVNGFLDARANTEGVMANIVNGDPQLAVAGGVPYVTTADAFIGWGWRSQAAIERAPEPWPVYGNGPQRKGYYTGGATLDGGSLVWTNTTQIGPGGAGIFGSGTADDQHYFISVDGYNVDTYELLAINLSDGTLDYGVQLVDWCNGTPAIAVDQVFCGDNAGFVYMVNKADGAIIWSNNIGGAVNSGLNLDRGKVYAKGDGYGVVALDAASGMIIWTNLHPNAGTWSGNGPSLSADGSVLYYKADNGDITGVNTADGSTIFAYTNGAAGFGSQDPIVDDSGNVYCQLYGTDAVPADDVIVSLTPAGAENWMYTFTGHVMNHGGLALSEDQATLYISHDTGFTALNTADGTLKWNTGAGVVGVMEGGCAVGAGNMIMSVAVQSGTSTAVGVKDNGASGDLVWQVPLDTTQSSKSGPVLLANGDVIVTTAGGEIARVTVPEPAFFGLLAIGLLMLIRRK